MAGTITIPLTTLTLGAHDFGPATVQAGDSLAVLTVDRTVANGLNATSGAHIDLLLSFSANGAAPWAQQVTAGIDGGQHFNNDKVTGLPVLETQSNVRVGLDQVQGMKVMATITVSGAQVAVAGSLAIT